MSANGHRRTIPLQALALLAVAGTIWFLHLGGHSLLVAVSVGIGAYGAINLAIWGTGRRTSSKRAARQRRNLEADIDEHRAQLYGDDP